MMPINQSLFSSFEVQRMPASFRSPRNRTCQTIHHLLPQHAPSLSCGCGWIYMIWLKSPTAKVERREVLFTGRDSKLTLQSYPSTGSLLDRLPIPCAFCDQVEWGLTWAKRRQWKPCLSPTLGGWFLFLYWGQNEVYILTQETPQERGHDDIPGKRKAHFS